MSEMQFFIGKFEKAKDQSILPEDTDDFYDVEKSHYVKVKGVLYSFYSIMDVDEDGFSTAIPEQSGPLVICYWYNGGAGLHEVVEEAIERYLGDLV